MAAEDSFSYLIPGHSEKHRRARNWTDAEMKGLLYVWEQNVAELKKCKRNAKIYEKMAQRFFELTGEQRHREEIKMKITNMSFQYRQVKMKCTTNGSGGTPDWPYYKAIEKLLTKTDDNETMNPFELQSPGPSTSTEASMSHAEGLPMGFLPEYTGSSDEMEMREDLDGWESSGSLHSGLPCPDSHPAPVKRKKVHQHLSLKRRKLKVMEAMLQEQRKVSRAVEETCREVRRVMHQQNFLQVQNLQLQERMMNLLEKMIQPLAAPTPAWGAAAQPGVKEPGQG
ncbi:myb/SANT-like DNA-binding domain-containing protein 1 isoform X1 [Coregonus clupeaformis]|uniref:myb/SANT-like DNA-binding domain-containing protein 1 isoform X1 n=1 Tax=Coregonus clupeaformis TaxID=59861 RepID=UPI001BE09703|nr:myb/SANT-like DNA-binding domain-containing protein 1 isoform X1 [Coregonus clupeaformis]